MGVPQYMLNVWSMLKWTALKCYSAKKLLIVVITAATVDFLYMSSLGNMALCDEYYALFEGYGQGYFDLGSLLFLLIFNGIPLYFAALSLDEQATKAGNHVLVRYDKKITYFYLNQFVYMLFLLLYFVIHLIIVSFYGLLFGDNSGLGEYYTQLAIFISYEGSPFSLLVMSIALRYLELLFFQSIIILLESLINKLSVIFILVICGYLSLFLIQFRYYPFGLSSIVRWTLLSDNIKNNFAVCAIIFMTASISIYIYMSKRGIYQLLERSF